MVVRVLAFARIRELLGFSEESMGLRQGAVAREIWDRLVVRAPQLEGLTGSTRLAVNGKLVAFETPLNHNDEVAFLPPVGGG